MAVDSSDPSYCVIAVRTDKTEVTLAQGLTMDRAIAIVDALSDAGAFISIRIEPELPNGIPPVQ